MILSIETSTSRCSAAIAGIDGKIIAHKLSAHKNEHTSILSVMIDEIVSRLDDKYAQLSAVAISKGPGSYTGLRAGYATAKGIAYACQIPLIEVSTFDILMEHALRPSDQSLFIPVIDARRMEFYAAHYASNGLRIKDTHSWIVTEEGLAQLVAEYPSICMLGTGVKKIDDLGDFQTIMKVDISPDAKYMGRLAANALLTKTFVSVAYSEPMYFKPPNITKSKKTLLGK